MEGLTDIRVKAFVGVRLPRGNQAAQLLKNSLLYANELDLPSDFLEYFDISNHTELVEETDKMPMFYAEKILNCLIETLEKNDREEKAKEVEKNEEKAEELAPEEANRKEEDQAEDDKKPKEEAAEENALDKGGDENDKSVLEKSVHQEEQNHSKDGTSHQTQDEHETKGLEPADKDHISQHNKSHLSEGKEEKSFHKEQPVQHEDHNENHQVHDVEQLLESQHSAKEGKSDNHHQELIGSGLAAVEDKQQHSEQQLNSSVRNEERVENQNVAQNQEIEDEQVIGEGVEQKESQVNSDAEHKAGGVEGEHKHNDDHEHAKDKAAEPLNNAEHNVKSEPEKTHQELTNEHETSKNHSVDDHKEFPQAHQEHLENKIQEEAVEKDGNLSYSTPRSQDQKEKPNESVHEDKEASGEKNQKLEPKSANQSKDQINQQEESEIQKKAQQQHEEEEARLKLNQQEEEAAEQKLKADEEAAKQKLKAEEEEAARLKLKQEQEEAHRQKQKELEEETARQKLKVQEEEEAARQRIKAEEEIAKQKLQAQEEEITRLKLMQQQEEAALQQFRAQEEEAAKQRAKAQEEEAAKAKKLLEEQEKEAELKRQKAQEEEDLKKKEWEAKELALAEKLKQADEEAANRKKKLEEEEESLRKQKEEEQHAADELAKQRLKEEEEAKIKLQNAEAASQKIKEEALAEAQRKKNEADLDAQKRKEDAEKEAKLRKEQAENEAERRKREAEAEIARNKEEFEKAQKAKLDEAERLAKIKQEEAEKEAKSKQKEAEEKVLKIQQQAEAEAERKRIESEKIAHKTQDDAEASARKRKEEAEAEALRIKEVATLEAKRIKEMALAQAKAQMEELEKEVQKRRKEEEERSQAMKINPQKTEPDDENKTNPPSTRSKQPSNLSQGNTKTPVSTKDPKQEIKVTFGKAIEQNNKSQSQNEKKDNQKPVINKSLTQETPRVSSERANQAQEKDRSANNSNIDFEKQKASTLEPKAVNSKILEQKNTTLEKLHLKPIVQTRMSNDVRGLSVNRPSQEKNTKTIVRQERKINNLVREPAKEENPKATMSSFEHSIGPVIKQKSGGNRNMTPLGTSSGRKSFSNTMNNYRPNNVALNPKPKPPTYEGSQAEDSETEKRPATSNLTKSNSSVQLEKKDQKRNSDSYRLNQLPKQNQTVPVRNHDNFLLTDSKLRPQNEARPKTREKLAPLNKSNLIESDFAMTSTLGDKRVNDMTEDPARENVTFKKWNSNKGEWKGHVPVGKPLNGLDANNPYNPTWTKMVLRNHFDVNIETIEDHQQGTKWKIRRVKNQIANSNPNPKGRKSPERNVQDSKADHIPQINNSLKGYRVSSGKKNPENKKQEKKQTKPILTVGDIPFGIDIIPANVYLSGLDTNRLESENREKFDTNWLAQTMLTLSNQGNQASALKAPRRRSLKDGINSARISEEESLSSQLIIEMPLFHPNFLANLEELKRMALLKQQIVQNQPIF